MEQITFREKISTQTISSGNNKSVIDEYIEKYEEIINELSNHLCITDIERDILNSIGEFEYFNKVCELSLMYYFFCKHKDTFKYQVESNLSKTQNINDKKKNYDIAFSTQNNFTFHIEIKTFQAIDYSNKEPIKFFLEQELVKKIYNDYSNNFSPNLMPKLSRFLKDANNQLPNVNNDRNIRIVIICCNDLDEYADVLTCLIHEKIGILTQNEGNNHNIVPLKSDLQNIDGIVLCNLGFEHNAIFSKEKFTKFYGTDELELSGSDVWDYERAIPVLPMLFWVNNDKSKNQKIATETAQEFQSLTAYYFDEYKNNQQDIQAALFKLFNDIINNKI